MLDLGVEDKSRLPLIGQPGSLFVTNGRKGSAGLQIEEVDGAMDASAAPAAPSSGGKRCQLRGERSR